MVNDARANEHLFRRMAFNALAWNCDNHVKDIFYLMDRRGEWCLAPVYDECYAYNPAGDSTSRHQMAVLAWPRFAAEAEVREEFAAQIAACLKGNE